MKSRVDEIKLTEQDIERNLKNIKENKPLDISLKILDGEFKQRYFHKEEFKPEKRICKECLKDFIAKNYNKIYCSKKCARKAWIKYIREYHKKPEVKKKRKEYDKEYWHRPEVKRRWRERIRKKNKIPKSRWRIK